MIQALREYQKNMYVQARESLRKNRAVCIQAPTGSGKTPLIAAMCSSVYEKDKTAWILVIRKELLAQSSKHLTKWAVPHNMINPKSHESRAYNVHVVSSDTLVRRYGKIKRWPDLLIIDEAHLTLDRQIAIEKYLPKTSKIVGLTATPERGDGRGLSKKAGGIYDDLIIGPSIPFLTSGGYLAPLKYFSPPLDGLNDVKRVRGEYDEEGLDGLLKRRKVYGQVVDHYEKYGKGKPALMFCRSIKAAEHTAERFRDKGFKFYNIDSTMSDEKRFGLMDAIVSGKIEGLTGVDIFSYGVDLPNIEYGAMLRPTISKSLYMQMVGRIIRPYTDPVTGYKKEYAQIFDHVNNVLEHQDDNYPGVPLHYVPEITWNFNGVEKRKKNKKELNVVLCPHLDFLYCNNPHCQTCSSNPDKTITDARQPMVLIPTELEEVKKPVALADRAASERKELEDRIGAAVLDYNATMSPGAVGELLKIADECGYKPLWVYWRLTDASRLTVNIPLLAEIARQRNFKKGWVYFATQQVKTERHEIKEYERAMA